MVIFIGIYNSTITHWINENKTTTTTINPIIPITTSQSLTVPYGSIFSSNAGVILLPPLLFIAFAYIAIRKFTTIAIKKEILSLYDSIGIEYENDSLAGSFHVSNKKYVSVISHFNGLFELSYDNKVIAIITGDELFWKKKYLEFIHKNENLN